MITSENCTGCSACFNICPTDAISMEFNSKGFWIPVVSAEKCIGCNLCNKVCLKENEAQGSQPLDVLAAFSKNDEIRFNSTSGGVFVYLAEFIIEQGGIVFGASLRPDLSVKHISIVSTEDLCEIKKSKYLQSEIGEIFRQVKSALEEGKTVLFSGTPCQVTGLKLFLSKDYKKLFTVDILCHGVPSKKLFDKYVAAEEKKADANLVMIDFRCKELGWKNYFTKRSFDDGINVDCDDTFVPGFLSDYFLNDSCYCCRFANSARQGDISLGDYWGYKEKSPDYIEDDNKGINLVLLNTEKGRHLFKKVKSNLAIEKRTLEDAQKCNPILIHPSVKPERYVEFQQDVQNFDWDALQSKYFGKQQVKDILSPEKKAYFNQPYEKRHFKHWLKYTKRRIVK